MEKLINISLFPFPCQYLCEVLTLCESLCAPLPLTLLCDQGSFPPAKHMICFSSNYVSALLIFLKVASSLPVVVDFFLSVLRSTSWSVSVRSGICRVASLGTKEPVGTIFAPLPLIWIQYHLLRVAHPQTGCLAYLLQIPCPVALENLLFWSNWYQSQCSETLPQKTSTSLNLEV